MNDSTPPERSNSDSMSSDDFQKLLDWFKDVTDMTRDVDEEADMTRDVDEEAVVQNLKRLYADSAASLESEWEIRLIRGLVDRCYPSAVEVILDEINSFGTEQDRPSTYYLTAKGELDGLTALHKAVEIAACVRSSLTKEADVNGEGCGAEYVPRLLEKKAAHVIAEHSMKVVRLLLEKGADANAKDGSGLTALSYALDHPEIVTLLLQYEANPNVKDKDGQTLLHIAAGNGCDDTRVIEDLLKAGADPNAKDAWDDIPLVLALQHDQTEIAQLLLKHGASTQAKVEGYSVLYLAVQFGRLEIVRMMLEMGADIGFRTDDGTTALLLAVDCGHIEVARCLLEHGAGIEDANNDGWCPLHIAMGCGDIKMIELLLEQGASIESRDPESEGTALHAAIDCGNVDVVRLLLSRGANIKAMDIEGQTPLGRAISKPYPNLIKLLEDADR